MRYVLVMLGSLVGWVIVDYLLLYLLISVGCIYPANYAEQKINEAYDTICLLYTSSYYFFLPLHPNQKNAGLLSSLFAV